MTNVNGQRVRRHRLDSGSDSSKAGTVVTIVALLALGVPGVKAQFGNGSDGSLNVFAGIHNITSDMNFVNVTVFPGTTLNTNGFTINVSGTLLNQGTITDLTSGGDGGLGGWGGAEGLGMGIPPQVGEEGLLGSGPSNAGGGTGGQGGGGGGGGGVAWEPNSSHFAAGGYGGNGGAGGKGGGVIKINAFDLQNVGVIHADGQNGSSGIGGAPGGYHTWILIFNFDLAGGGGGGGGGGYGGNGGTVSILYGTLVNSGDIRAFPGSGGGGAPGGPGVDQSYASSFGTSQYTPGASSASNGGFGGDGAVETDSSGGGLEGGIGLMGMPGTVSLIKYSCCAFQVGNVDCSPGDGVDVGDLTTLIDNLFITFSPLCCLKEANCDGDAQSNIDVADLTALIDNLFINFSPLPLCN